jgi:hypothetical protein
MAPLSFLQSPEKIAPPFVPDCTEFLARSAAEGGGFGNILNGENGHHRYGCIGLRDLEPMLRPGSVVSVDMSVRRLQENDGSKE